MKPTHILVPTDFSDSSREATDYALEFARSFGASITLFHVIEDPVVYIPALGGYLPKPRDFEDFSDAALAEWITAEDSQGVTIKREWEHGHPVSRILNYATQHGCDLIVMGTHGRGVLDLLMGSIAERVVRTSNCPVLTVRPKSAQQ
ncbi:MAG: universal stress protein [Planctomycetota bacterium]|nr:universal stress protein [Planctomycetota bacterium]MDA1163346.1 universal stress protein [Planctomycetota bacterium]